MLTKALFFFSLISVAFATVLITTPIISTVYTGGQAGATVVWKDDGTSPSLETFGNATVSIYVGNKFQQTSLQLLATVDVSKASSITFTPDASIGPDSSDYFIRIQSLASKAANGDPDQSFSSKFTLQNMSGKFNASVSAEIAGQSTAPLGAQSSTAGSSASTTSSGASATSSASSTSKNSSGSSSSTSATAKPSSAAMGLTAGWAGIVFGAVFGVAMF